MKYKRQVKGNTDEKVVAKYIEFVKESENQMSFFKNETSNTIILYFLEKKLKDELDKLTNKQQDMLNIMRLKE